MPPKKWLQIESFFEKNVYLCGDNYHHQNYKHGKQKNDNDRSKNHYQ